MQEMLLEVIRVQSGVSINWNRLTQYHKPVGIYLACKPTKLPQVWLFMWTVIRDKLWGHFNETDMHAHKHLATQKIMRNHTYFMWKHTYFMENHTHFLQEATWTAGPLHLPTTSVCRGSEAQATGQPKPCTPVDVLLVCCIVVGFGVCICILHVKPPELPFVICTCHDITGKENITLRCTLCIYILLVIYILLQEEHTTHSPSSSPPSILPLISTSSTYNSDSWDIQTAIEAALKDGYRSIDCAPIYQNEAGIGEALQKCFQEGVVKREDIFVTSKLW